jgi:hypothetical protein
VTTPDRSKVVPGPTEPSKTGQDPTGSQPLAEARNRRIQGRIGVAAVYAGVVGVTAAASGDPTSRRYLAGYVVMVLFGLPCAVVSYRKTAKTARTAVALHGGLLPLEPSWRRHLRRSAIVLWNCCGLITVVMAATGSPKSDGTTTVPAAVGLGWFIVALAAVATTAPLLERKPSAAHRAEWLTTRQQEIAPYQRASSRRHRGRSAEAERGS